MGSVNVRSIATLEHLHVALARFSGETQQALGTAAEELRRVENWLEERLAYWNAEISRRQVALGEAQQAYNICRMPQVDPETGAVYQAPCTEEYQAVMMATWQLEEAVRERNIVLDAQALIGNAASNYFASAARLAEHLERRVPVAGASLSEQIRHLREFAAMQTPTTSSDKSAVDALASRVAELRAQDRLETEAALRRVEQQPSSTGGTAGPGAKSPTPERPAVPKLPSGHEREISPEGEPRREGGPEGG